MLGGLCAIRDSLVTPLDTITCITMLNRKSAGRRAGGSTRRSGERSRVVSGRGGGVEARGRAGVSGGVVEGEFLAGRSFELGDEPMLAPLGREAVVPVRP